MILSVNRSALAIAAAWAVASVSHAALPSLTIEGQGKTEKLELQELSISVELKGGIAETVLELEFLNHTSRMQEGEFVLQLPEGATISTYALEVNGKMRPGVAVEKEQARHAYESIKRQMIDPGLVEREAGNLYRTRIFPIPARGTKRVRMGYLQTLENAELEFALNDGQKLKSFSCRVKGGDSAELSLQGVEATDEGGEWSGKNVTLNGSLKVEAEMPEVGKAVSHAEMAADGTVYFFAQGDLGKEWKPKPRSKPNRIRILWDGSRSGHWRDHDAELKALERYLKWAGDCEVTVQVLRAQLEKPRRFMIRKGDASGVVAVLKKVAYDGGADLSQIDEFEGTTLFFTDGEISSPVWTRSEGRGLEHPFFVMANGKIDGDSGLESGGAEALDLRTNNWWERLTMILDGVSVAGHTKGDWVVVRKGGRYLVAGRLPRGEKGTVTIRPDGAEPIAIQGKDALQSDSEWTFARRVWAQHRLAELEREKNRAEIIEFAIAERMVSDETSLIVLERFEDHIRYRIPPPESDLLTRYQAELEKSKEGARSRILTQWRLKREWHRTEYPWIDWKLAEEVGAVGVWVKSSREVFPKETLNEQALKPYEAWLPEAKRVVAAKVDLQTEKDFENWRRRVGRSMERLQAIRDAPWPKSKPGQPIHVSVRGFVNRRGVFSSEAPWRLRDAIEAAGGPHPIWGDWSRVYLYRNSLRTGYNLESEQYQPVPLRWGDMIVVETDPDYRSNFLSDGFAAPVDPFAAPAAGGSGMRRSMGNQPAVFEAPGAVGVPANSQALGLPAPFGEPGAAPIPVSRNMKIELVSREVEKLATGIDKKAIDRLGAAKDPGREYEILARNQALSAGTTVAAARLFFSQSESAMGMRALSNLLELMANKVEATRAMAMWLVEFGEEDSAVIILNRLLELVPDEATKNLIRFDLARISGEAEDFGAVVLGEIESREPTGLPTIALTDYFGRGGEPRGELRVFEAHSMKSDVRVVVAAAGESVELAVREPGAATENRIGLSIHGGRIQASERVSEYQMRHGLPGTYEVICRRPGGGNFAGVDMSTAAADDLPPITLRVTWYTGWGGQDQTVVTKTVLMEAGEVNLDGLRFGWGEE